MVDPLDVTNSSGAAQTKSGASKQKLAEDMDQFMNLLVTQLQNQDPLDPMDANEFTQQLVQFASVEQQIQGNSNLEKMLEMQQKSMLGTLVGYIGSHVEITGQDLPLEDGDATGTYSLEGDAASTTITIADDTGKVVFFADGETEMGRHLFHWDGNDNFDIPMDDGIYKVTVSSVDYDGEPVNVGHTIVGKVTAVSTDEGQVSLTIGETDYPADNVISVGLPRN